MKFVFNMISCFSTTKETLIKKKMVLQKKETLHRKSWLNRPGVLKTSPQGERSRLRRYIRGTNVPIGYVLMNATEIK